MYIACILTHLNHAAHVSRLRCLDRIAKWIRPAIPTPLSFLNQSPLLQAIRPKYKQSSSLPRRLPIIGAIHKTLSPISLNVFCFPRPA